MRRSAIGSLFLCFLLLSTVACGRFGNQETLPGVGGKISLGNEMFPSGKARRIVVAIYEEKDFSTDTSLPKTSAKPLMQASVTGLSSPPYNYDLPTANLTGLVRLFAFLDQDDSGGDSPNPGDFYGAHKEVINLTGYRLSFDIVIDKKLEP